MLLMVENIARRYDPSLLRAAHRSQISTRGLAVRPRPLRRKLAILTQSACEARGPVLNIGAWLNVADASADQGSLSSI